MLKNSRNSKRHGCKCTMKLVANRVLRRMTQLSQHFSGFRRIAIVVDSNKNLTMQLLPSTLQLKMGRKSKKFHAAFPMQVHSIGSSRARQVADSNIQDARRLNHRRKTRALVATIVSLFILIGGFAAWVVHRGHVRDAVALLVKQVEDQLTNHQVPSAEALLASQPDLAGEVDVAAIAAKVTQAKPQWRRIVRAFSSWKEEIAKASTGDISKAKLDSMLGAVAVLKPNLTDDEVKQRDQLVSKAKTVLDGTVAKRLTSLTPKSNALVLNRRAL